MKVLLVCACLVAPVALFTVGRSDGGPAVRAGAKYSPFRDLPERRASVWAVGDGDGGSRSARLVRRIRRADPDLFLYLGDVYDRGTAEDYANDYDRTFGLLKRRTAPTAGNHDWPNQRHGYFPYWRKALGRGLGPYYSMRIAGWQLLSMNSQSPHGPGSPQLRWLRSRLKGSGTCRLAFWHRPRFNAGTVHGEALDMAPMWDALSGRARLVVSAHEHTSQVLRQKDGLTQIIAGSGGHGLYPVDFADSRLLFGNATEPAALRLSLRPGGAHYAFVSSSGSVLNRGSVRCERG